MKRNLSGVVVAAGLVLVGLAAGVVSLLRPREGTCVVLFTIDTLRADHVGCYGDAAARTPVMDGLAASGALFEDCSASAPLTLPSHATILTGLHPPRHGLRDNDTPHPLPPADRRPFRTAAEILREGGWQTGAFVSGASLSPRWGLDAGFDEYGPPPETEAGNPHLGERDGAETTGAALAWLGRRDRGRPFFLWVHLFDPHFPYAAPGGGGHPPDSVEAYDEEVAYADRQVGRVLDYLKSEDLLDRTVVALTADHGEGLGEHGEATHGYFLHRSTLRVPLLLRLPGRIHAGSRVKEPVALVDLLPTLLDVVGRPVNGPFDGKSLLPRVSGTGEAAAALVPSEQYAETTYGWRSFRWAQSVSVRNGNRRIIDAGGDRREIHDLDRDPREETDLAGSPDPGDAAAAARAWTLFASAPLSNPAPGAPGTDGRDLQGLGYITPYSPVKILPPGENGLLPLPSASLLHDFDAALRILQRPSPEETPEQALDRIHLARTALEALDGRDPRNPAFAFWIGRTWREEAKARQGDASEEWKKAGARFQEAGKRGYAEPRTVSLILQAAYNARMFDDMLWMARFWTDKGLDGDADFWTWVAVAWMAGDKDARRITAGARAHYEEALQKAKDRARGPAEDKRIREVEALYK